MKAPSLFIGHGSPMNALANNSYTKKLNQLRALCPQPKAILCVSAHFLTRGGCAVTHMATPKTIHDFYGFPKELFAVQYPAPGHPALAEEIAHLTGAALDDTEWGLDHGTWSVLKHIYPDASVPVVQLSMDPGAAPQRHFEMGQKLKPLRDQGVLIVGSGNVVHNLRRISWEADAVPFSWAQEFDRWVQQKLQARDTTALWRDFMAQPSGPYSVPTVDHYLPLLYVIGASEPSDQYHLEYQEIQNGSISMLSFSMRAA